MLVWTLVGFIVILIISLLQARDDYIRLMIKNSSSSCSCGDVK